MMRGTWRPVRAANQAPNAILMLANIFGGTVILSVLFKRKVTMRYREVTYNCALQVANPRSAMIIGYASSISQKMDRGAEENTMKRLRV